MRTSEQVQPVFNKYIRIHSFLCKKTSKKIHRTQEIMHKAKYALGGILAGALFTYGMIAGAYKTFPYYVLYPVKQHIDNVIAESQRPDMEFSQANEQGATEAGIWQVLPLPSILSLDNETELNSFAFNWTRIESDEIGRVGAARFDDDAVRFINRNDSILLEHLGLQENVTQNGGIMSVFELGGEEYAYLSTIVDLCASARIVKVTDESTVYEFPCLPEEPTFRPDEPKKVDFNASGGAVVQLDDNTVLLSTGTPTDTSDLIRNLAQDDTSQWGKFLRITLLPDGKLDVSNFAKGVRNPQGMKQINGLIYATDHGPRGGDEINLIEEGRNYGWPLQSLGTFYSYAPIKKEYGDAAEEERPIESFVPSIAPSYIGNCPTIYEKYYTPNNCVAISTLRAESIYFIVMEANRHVLFTERMELGSRIRKFEINGNRLTAITDYEGVIVGEFSLIDPD